MSTPQTFKPSAGKREEFRKYLEKAGIMDALTKVLVDLYEEVDKPEDALVYIIDKLSLQAGLETQKQLNAKLEEAYAHIKTVETEIEALKVQVAEVEGGQEGVESRSTHSAAHPEAAEEGGAAEGGEEQPQPAQ